MTKDEALQIMRLRGIIRIPKVSCDYKLVGKPARGKVWRRHYDENGDPAGEWLRFETFTWFKAMVLNEPYRNQVHFHRFSNTPLALSPHQEPLTTPQALKVMRAGFRVKVDNLKYWLENDPKDWELWEHSSWNHGTSHRSNATLKNFRSIYRISEFLITG